MIMIRNENQVMKWKRRTFFRGMNSNKMPRKRMEDGFARQKMILTAGAAGIHAHLMAVHE